MRARRPVRPLDLGTTRGMECRALWQLVFGCLLLLAGCAPSPSDALRFGLASSPITLDPRFATDAASTRVNRLLYRRLVDFDENFRAVPSLAGWQQISRTQYRFALGDDGRQSPTPLAKPATLIRWRTLSGEIARMLRVTTRRVAHSGNMARYLVSATIVV